MPSIEMTIKRHGKDTLDLIEEASENLESGIKKFGKKRNHTAIVNLAKFTPTKFEVYLKYSIRMIRNVPGDWNAA
jgi:hypothetical protein